MYQYRSFLYFLWASFCVLVMVPRHFVNDRIQFTYSSCGFRYFSLYPEFRYFLESYSVPEVWESSQYPQISLTLQTSCLLLSPRCIGQLCRYPQTSTLGKVESGVCPDFWYHGLPGLWHCDGYRHHATTRGIRR